MMIYNMTQHALTPAQMTDGLCEFPAAQREAVVQALTIKEKPTRDSLQQRATHLSELAAACGVGAVMLGGAPYLMPLLVQTLHEKGIRTFFSFSPRRSTERRLADGTVEKAGIFSYEGLLEI